MECKINPESWPELKSNLRLQFSNLDEDDLVFTSGREDELLERIKRKSGREKDEVISIINQIEINLRAKNLE